MEFLKTELCRLLNIEYPIIQAGMAGGSVTPELVAGVSEAGGLGTLGAAYMTKDTVRDAIRNIKTMTDKPFAVNLFSVEMKDNFDRLSEVMEILTPIRENLGLKKAGKKLSTTDHFDHIFEVVLEERVPVLSTAFGVLKEDAMKEAKKNGARILTMATTVDEGLFAEEKGSDAVVAQGSEAGGHRSTFDMKKYPEGASIGTFSLIPQMADALKVPVIAAGGIMDGRGLAAALILGAAGVQLGTRFLTALESGAHPVYQKKLLEAKEDDTVITKSFSGRPARGIVNSFIRHTELSGIAPLPFPSQNTATNEIRKAAAEQNNSEYMSLWAGQGLRMVRQGESSSQIVACLIKEAESILTFG
ncbi:NAD(P)H-dependent flavin oxidoreductase [Metabacillus sp. RGM 3146]|uniref:NAD(P)H-dependent flavin oxidoreductase n=1 Tax=Metabacillus sp. RGM 3146 TaxID=3401092 RepID=UPI003B9CE745